MPLTSREAFKTGFLLRCAEEGLDSDAVFGRIKTAQARQSEIVALPAEEQKELFKQAGGFVDLAKAIGNFALRSPLYAAAFGGLGGAAIGYGGGQFMNQYDPSYVNPTVSPDIEDIQAAEMIAALRRESSTADRRTQLLIDKERKREEEDEKAKHSQMLF